MARLAESAALYFMIVFVAAFALGALRVSFIAPRFGAVAAVSMEVPITLVLSWFVCSQVMRLFEIPNEWLPRLVIGALAFVLLMIAEPATAILGFGRSVREYFETFQSTAGLIGLIGQIAFALIPLVQAKT